MDVGEYGPFCVKAGEQEPGPPGRIATAMGGCDPRMRQVWVGKSGERHRGPALGRLRNPPVRRARLSYIWFCNHALAHVCRNTPPLRHAPIPARRHGPCHHGYDMHKQRDKARPALAACLASAPQLHWRLGIPTASARATRPINSVGRAGSGRPSAPLLGDIPWT